MKLIQKKKLATKWGRWVLNKSKPISLDIDTGYDTYWIEINLCQTIDTRIMWLIHLSEKNWISERDLINLACAFSDLFGDKFPKPRFTQLSSITGDISSRLELACQVWDRLKEYIELNQPNSEWLKEK